MTTRTHLPVVVMEHLPDDVILDAIAHGQDVEELERRWARAEFKRRMALGDAEKYAEDHPAEPLPAGMREQLVAELMAKRIGKCPEHWIHGTDEVGHSFAKEIYCGREWCPVCGSKNSVAHLRRFARWLPKVQTEVSIGYFVIEMPFKGRERWHSKAGLERAGKLITSVLKGDYEIEQRRKSGEKITKDMLPRIRGRWYKKGLRRVHFFGDAPESIGIAIEKEQGVERLPLGDEFTTRKYNPHFNVLVPGGLLSDAKLEYIKAMLRAAFCEPTLIVNYSFTKEPGRIVHLLKYVTRATFLDIRWDKYLAGSLFGFRNMRSWGKWEVDKPAWSLDDVASDAAAEVAGVNIAAVNALGECHCYLDGLPITWSRPQPISLLHLMQEKQPGKIQSLGAGYYRLPDLLVPAHRSFESDTMRWTLEINKILADWRAEQRCRPPP